MESNKLAILLITLEKLYRVRDLMNENVRDCLVTNYEWLIDSLELPDANDHHVLAAAIIRHNYKLVFGIASKIYNRRPLITLELQDLVNAGLEGVIKAANCFDL